MGKKMKLVLDDLKVQSFVTALNGNHTQNVKGGETGFCTDEPACEDPGTVSCGGTCYTDCGCPVPTDEATCTCNGCVGTTYGPTDCNGTCNHTNRYEACCS